MLAFASTLEEADRELVASDVVRTFAEVVASRSSPPAGDDAGPTYRAPAASRSATSKSVRSRATSPFASYPTYEA